MPTLQQLRRTIQHASDLQSVVRTMKSLAAVSIRGYENAADALDDYAHTVRLGLMALSFEITPFPPRTRPPKDGRRALLVFGSDQGMCGSFNEVLAGSLDDQLENADTKPDIFCVGTRLAALLRARSHEPDATFQVPMSVESAVDVVQDLIVTVAAEDQESFSLLNVAYNRHTGGSSYEPNHLQLLPIDKYWLRQMDQEKWPTNAMPFLRIDASTMFRRVTQEWIFAALTQAMCHSLASENAARLAAMQAAENNIEERLDTLTLSYHQQRQQQITEELQDISAGFQALSND